MSTHAELEVLRAEFERICKLPEVLKQINFPLGAMQMNGGFHHYMDSDTDSAWIGFKLGHIAGMRAAKAAPASSASAQAVAHEALQKIIDAHRFNTAALKPAEVHTIAFNALHPEGEK